MTSNIIKSFSDKAYSYDSQSFVQKDVNKRLLSRLDLIMHAKIIIKRDNHSDSFIYK